MFFLFSFFTFTLAFLFMTWSAYKSKQPHFILIIYSVEQIEPGNEQLQTVHLVSHKNLYFTVQTYNFSYCETSVPFYQLTVALLIYNHETVLQSKGGNFISQWPLVNVRSWNKNKEKKNIYIAAFGWRGIKEEKTKLILYPPPKPVSAQPAISAVFPWLLTRKARGPWWQSGSCLHMEIINWVKFSVASNCLCKLWNEKAWKNKWETLRCISLNIIWFFKALIAILTEVMQNLLKHVRNMNALSCQNHSTVLKLYLCFPVFF